MEVKIDYDELDRIVKQSKEADDYIGILLDEKLALAQHLKKLQRQPVMKWIPCAEKLPKDGEQVLTCDKTGYMALLEQYRGHWNCFVDPDGYLNTNNEMQVVAWMPLPEPYNAEEDTDEAD